MKSTHTRTAVIMVALAAAFLGMAAQAESCALPSDPATVLNIVFPLVDTNGDGGLSLTELNALYAGIPAQYFNIADANKDGKVSIAELTPFLSLLPGGDLLSMVDTNGNGTIEYAEVSQYVAPAQFALLDKDSNGVIDCADLGATPPAEGEPAEGEPVEGEVSPPAPCPLPEDILPFLTDLLIPVFDTDQSGGLSLAEIQALYPIPAEYVAYFPMIDMNQNGQVDPDELVSVASMLGIDLLGLVDTSADRIIQYSEVAGYVSSAQFALLDRNGNGVFDCGDTAPTGPCPLPETVFPALGDLLVLIFDRDESGGLAFPELMGLNSQLAESISDTDTDHSGEVDANELLAVALARQMHLLEPIDLNYDRAVQYDEVSGYGLSPEKFARVDLDGNGVFDCADLTAVSPEGEGETSPPCAIPAVNSLLFDAIFAILDANKDGGIAREEITRVAPIISASQLQTLFSILGVNGNGQVSRAALDALPGLFGALGFSMPGGSILGVVDTNGDGLIQLAEISPYVDPSLFAMVDANGNGVLDCEDLSVLLNGPVTEGEPAEGEPVEGETPPVACPLPDDVVAVLAGMLMPLFDADRSGGLSLAEIEAVYPIPAEYASYFSVIDLNRNGQIEADEIVTILAVLGVDPLGMIDTSGDRVLQYSEVSQYLTPALFALLDRSGNGVFDCADLTVVSPEGEGETSLPCAIPNVNSLLLDALLALLDANDDGGVTQAEIARVYPGFSSILPAGAWPFFDRNLNGKLSRSELGQLFPGDANLLGYIDTNGDGLIQLSEAGLYLDASMFAALDVNANGVLDCEDLNALLNIQVPEGEPAEGEPAEGEPVVACPLPDIRPMIARLAMLLDRNHDGLVCLDEVTALVGPLLDLGTNALPVDYLSYLALIDQNGDNCLDQAELAGLAALLPMNPVSYVDANGNGVLEQSEVGALVSPAIFAAADTNHNGALDCEDLAALIALLGGHEGEPAEGEPVEGEPAVYCPVPVDSIFDIAVALADINGDGVIDAAELRALAATPVIQSLLPTPLPTVADLFNAVDVNRNSVFEFAEISSVFTQDRFAAVDGNQNGVIDCEDLTTTSPVEGEGEPPVEGEGEATGLDDLLGGLQGSHNLGGLIADAFSLLDTNGDSALSYEEIAARLQLPRAVFRAADTNGDGLVTWEEASALALQAEGQSESVIEMVRQVAGRFGNQFFAPGDVIRVTLRLTKHGEGVLSQLHLLEALPEGWVLNLLSGAAGVSAKSVGANALVLDWSNATAFPLEVVYEATAPADASGLVTVTGQADYETDGVAASTGAVASVLAEALPQDQTHAADIDGDWHLSLSEVLRVVQLYNAGGYETGADTEDGYLPGSGKQAGVPHDADYTGDWNIDISELLRVVQLFNAPGGAYYRASGTEDGFVPGLF